MNANEAIRIAQVANGFSVVPAGDPGLPCPLSDCHVFQSLAELQAFIASHFTHRAPLVSGDPPEVRGANAGGAMLRAALADTKFEIDLRQPSERPTVEVENIGREPYRVRSQVEAERPIPSYRDRGGVLVE